jgi:hypothetical protein
MCGTAMIKVKLREIRESREEPCSQAKGKVVAGARFL